MPDIVFREWSKLLLIVALMGIVFSYFKDRKQFKPGWQSILILLVIAVNALIISLSATAALFYSVKLLIAPALLISVLKRPVATQEKKQLIYQILPTTCFVLLSSTSLVNWFDNDSMLAMLLLLQFWTLAFFLRNYVAPHNERTAVISQSLYTIFLLLLSLLFLANSFFSSGLALWHLSLALLFLMTCILWQILSFKVSLRPLIPAEEAGNMKYLHSGLSRGNTHQEIRKLNRYLTQSKVYRTPDLKLKDLSEQMGVSTHHLSQIINTGTNKSFYEYINEFRVDEARKMLTDSRYEYLSTEGIAQEAGFKNKNSYHNYFKRYTGTTPARYRKTYKS